MNGTGQFSFFLKLCSLSILLSGCLPSSNNGPRQLKSSGESGPDSTATATATVTPTGTVTPGLKLLRFFDPSSLTYKSVVNLPKNYGKFLYIEGSGIANLSDKFLKVKFYFGTDHTEVSVDAIVGRNPEAVPNTDGEVLIIDLSKRPFDQLQLDYDLFDYNIYATGDTPYTDPRKPGLYCRGLLLEDDPTFTQSGDNPLCDAYGETCLYAYAKIEDRGLLRVDTGAIQNVSLPQITFGTGTYNTEDKGLKLHKCLPDVGVVSYASTAGVLDLNTVGPLTATYNTDVLTLDGVNYRYQGPYRTWNTTDWQIGAAAAIYMPTFPGTASFPPRGLFMDSLNGTVDAGIQSYLFPRAGKMKLKTGITYLGVNSTPPVPAARSLKTMLSTNTTSEMMDGCNFRVTNTDFGPLGSGEGISSCNVSAYVEVYSYDPSSGLETRLYSNRPGVSEDLTNGAREMKLQLIRPMEIKKVSGVEIETLHSSFKSCKTSNSCGPGECCYNRKCWNQSFVPQCLESAKTNGLISVGQSCNSDFKCASLCCSGGTCQAHNILLAEPLYCGKAPGAPCVAKEWCRRDTVTVCKVYKLSTDAVGVPTCGLRCIPTPTHGECIGGTCQAVIQPTPETFDPNNTTACANAPEFPGT